jgi:ATP-binding cassette subfamily B protein
MMGGGLDGARRILGQEATVAKDRRATLARLASYFRPYGLVLVGVLVLIVYSAWSQVTVPLLMLQAVDCFLVVTPQSAQSCWFVATPGPDLAGLSRLVLIMVALFVSGAVVGGLTFYLMSWTGQHVLVRLRQQVFRQAQGLSVGYYTQHEAGDVMSRLTSDVDTIQQAISFGLVQVLSGALLIAWIVFDMVRLNVAYALLSLVILPFMIWATLYLSGQARKAFRQSRLEMGSVNAGLQESIAGVREAQAFSREDENIADFRRTNAANRSANVRAVRYTSALAPTLELLSFIAIAIVVGIGGIWALRGTPVMGTVFTLGLVVAYLGYVQRLNQPIQMIAVLWTNLQSALAGSERIFEFLDEAPAIWDLPTAQPMPAIVGHVRFGKVWAGYEPERPVLKGIDLEALPGQTIAIVGPTGAGKTTIINLIPRFWDVTAGQVTIDDIDVRDVTQDSLRRQIGLVLQDTFLFSDTVLNNIRYGRPEASDEEVVAAARMVQADAFIERLPEGFQTVLGERGGGLSQGQRQLIAIARAALVNPRILILDEATSSVDTRTERLIQQALETLMAGRTSFVVAHRLSTVRNADQVIVLEDGQIVEQGTHDGLLARGGAYYRLYMSQFRDSSANGAMLPATLAVAALAGAGAGGNGPNGPRPSFMPAAAFAATAGTAGAGALPLPSVNGGSGDGAPNGGPPVGDGNGAGPAAGVPAAAAAHHIAMPHHRPLHPRTVRQLAVVIVVSTVAAALLALGALAWMNGGTLRYEPAPPTPAAVAAPTQPA